MIATRLLLVSVLFCTFAFGRGTQALEKRICGLSTDGFNSWMRHRNNISKEEKKDILKVARKVLREDNENCRTTAVSFMSYLSSSDEDVSVLIKHFFSGKEHAIGGENYSRSTVIFTLGEIAGRGNDKALKFLKKIIRSRDNSKPLIKWDHVGLYGCMHGRGVNHGLAQSAMFGLLLSERWDDLQDMVKEYENDPDLAYLVKSIKNKKSVRS